MVRRLSRKTLLSRLMTAGLVVVFMASLTGVGGAAPVVQGSQETTATPPAEMLTPEATPPEAIAPEAEPEAPGDEPAPDASAQGDVPERPVAPAAPVKNVTVPAAIAPAAATGVSMTFEGYRPSAEDWTTGNIDPTGTYYYECDYVPLRLVIENKGDTAWTGSPVILLDHHNSGAIGWDVTQEWHFNVTPDAPADTGSEPPASGGITVVETFPGGEGTSQYLRCVLPELTIPADQFGTVYFQAHLALTPYWNDRTGSDGAQAWPGASLHVTLEDGGAKTLPIPVPLAPPGAVEGLKFLDAAPLGSYEGETGLGGWGFTLTRLDEFSFTMEATSSASAPVGTFSFEGLPAGTYTLDETPQTGWETEYDLPLTIELERGGTFVARVGNYRPPVTKTFSLSLDGLASNVGLFVTYQIDGGSWSSPVQLSGSGPYTGSVELPHGTHLTGVRWYASYAGQDVLLYQETIDETLTDDVTNPGDYDSSVSGHKFADLDVDESWDATEPGLPGWEIHLMRSTPSGEVTYAVTTTGVGGAYSFEDPIPGDYRLVEVQKSGYYNTVAPAAFTIPAGGADRADRDFGNVLVLSGIDVTKSGPDAAHVGDVIDYLVTVRNAGTTPLYDVDVYDPMFGGLIAEIPVLNVGDLYEYPLEHEVTESDDDPLENIVLASGTDLLGDLKSDTATWTVDIIHPALAVSKTVDFNGDGVFSEAETYYAGASAVWMLHVANTGDSDLFGVTVTDSNGFTLGPVDLAVGESTAATYGATIEADTVNSASAEGYDELEEPVGPATDEASVDAISPAVSISKTVDFDGDGVFSESETDYAGEEADWLVVVENTGDSTVTIDLSDSNGHDFGAPFVLGPDDPPAVFPYSTFVYSDTIDTATASVTDELGGSFEVDDSADVSVVFGGDLNLSKTVDFDGDGVFHASETYYAGEEATWRIVVSNGVEAGPIYGVTVTDTNGESFGPFDLASGETTTFEYTDIIDEDTVNTVTARGYDELENEVGPISDEARAIAISPSITVEKSSDAPAEGVLAGTTVTYTFLVTNGPEPLTDVQLDDPILGFSADLGDLAAGESTEVSASAVLTVPTTNTVTVVGLDELQNEVSDDDDLFVDVGAPLDIDMSIEKEADRETAEPGQIVTYTLTYRNTGSSRIQSFTITDDFDERYLTVTDAAGGDVVDGTIVWQIDEPIDAGDSGTITYKVKIDEDMPSGTTNVDNVVVIVADGDENPDNDVAEERVVVSFLPFTPKKEKFLPFTGSEALLLGLAAVAAAACGAGLRRRSRRAA